jgi:hypothetical protein
MSDPQRELRDRLQALDDELARTDPADRSQRERLEALRGDVRSLLEHARAAPPPPEHAGVRSLRDSLQHFEVTHPALAAMIEQVLATLSNLGV